MTRKPPTGSEKVTDPKAQLRRRAEKIVQENSGKAVKDLKALSTADLQRLIHDLQVHEVELELQNEELRRLQDVLEVSRARYFDLYDMAPVGYFTLDENGNITEVNLAGANLLGIARRDLIKQAFGRFVVRDHADSHYLRHRELFKTGVPQSYELQLARKNSEPLSAWIETMVAPDSGGARTCRQVVTDISLRKKAERLHAMLEDQLRESQKMEALGTLAGGVAHDFNNIIGAILGNVELARHDARANWQALLSLDEIQKAGLRAKDLVQQILTFSRRQPVTRRLLSLPAVVEETVHLLRATSRSVRIKAEYADDAPSIMADPTQVQQVLLNLGNNAVQAMEAQPGNIDIRVEGVTLNSESVHLDFKLRPGRYARVSISDTGCGMDVATQRRIFEPFFTTKLAGKGTGLGLAVAHGIMNAHDGAIVVHSELGKGSRFDVYFPQATATADILGTTEKPGPASEGRGRHILYVDDDEAQLFMVKRMLERWGYRVSVFCEQQEALNALQASMDNFDLVLTDFNMPGISGLDIARAVREAQPDLPVVMISGYITDFLRVQASAAGVREMIPKPFDVEEFRDVLQNLLSPPQVIARDQV